MSIRRLSASMEPIVPPAFDRRKIVVRRRVETTRRQKYVDEGERALDTMTTFPRERRRRKRIVDFFFVTRRRRRSYQRSTSSAAPTTRKTHRDRHDPRTRSNASHRSNDPKIVLPKRVFPRPPPYAESSRHNPSTSTHQNRDSTRRRGRANIHPFASSSRHKHPRLHSHENATDDDPLRRDHDSFVPFRLRDVSSSPRQSNRLFHRRMDDENDPCHLPHHHLPPHLRRHHPPRVISQSQSHRPSNTTSRMNLFDHRQHPRIQPRVVPSSTIHLRVIQRSSSSFLRHRTIVVRGGGRGCRHILLLSFVRDMIHRSTTNILHNPST